MNLHIVSSLLFFSKTSPYTCYICYVASVGIDFVEKPLRIFSLCYIIQFQNQMVHTAYVTVESHSAVSLLRIHRGELISHVRISPL